MNKPELLKGSIMIALAAFLAERYLSGKLYFYISPRFDWLTVVAVGILVVMALAVDRRGSAHAHGTHSHAPALALALVALPFVLGMLVPARPLGAGAVANRGFANEAVLPPTDSSSVASIAGTANILTWLRAIRADAGAVIGKDVDVIGFVYRDERFAPDEFMISRLTVVCCVADASALGLVVQAENAGDFSADTWVRVRGVFADGSFDGRKTPVVQATGIEKVEPPAQPYLYP